MASNTPIPSLQTTALTAQCYCKSVHFTVTIPNSHLPLAVHLCNCTICRRVHGALSCFHAPLPAGVTPSFIAPSSLSTSVTRYTHSQSASARIFCKTCGCHVGDEDIKPESTTGVPEWRVATSIFASHGPEHFQIRSHIFTAAGTGLHTFLPSIAGRTIGAWSPDPDDDRFPIPASEPPAPKPETDDQGNARLRAECHCGGVSFTLPRPSAATAAHPFLGRFVSKRDPTKWLATLDLCDDCRLVTGTHVIAWTFVPLAQLQPAVSADFTGFGTLVAFKSSEHVLRAFCGVCGATVFYTADTPDRVGDGSPDQKVVDVAVGMLKAPEGALAEGWLTWRTGRISYFEDGKIFDRDFAEGLAEGLAKWSMEKYGEMVNFRLP